MAKNYFIGIGGTGARVAEALVHVCAAGYGPKELSLFLIDPDSGNGNLNRTIERIGTYRQCRDDLARLHDGEVPLFHTDLKTPDNPKNLTWDVLDKDATLEKEVGLDALARSEENPPLADFIRVLYTDEELKTKLDEGFRGHPSIGSALMADIEKAAASDPWRTFWKDVEEAPREPDALRVFLAGSVFGGTGAAGVPTLGHPHIIKEHKEAALDGGENSKVTLGSALVLPYFSIGAPSASAAERMHVTTNDFPVATKAALQYYEDCIERGDLAFDQLYLIGDSNNQKVGDFSAGADDQENDPHHVEIITSLAALDFFEQPGGADATANGEQHFTARRDGPVVRWNELPFSRDSDSVRERRNHFERLMKTMTVFCYLLHTHGEDTLAAAENGDVLESWYNDHFSSNMFGRMFSGQSKGHLDPTSKENQDAREEVATYANNFLAWIAAMDDSGVALVNESLLVKEGSAGEVTLRDPQKYEDNLADLFGDGGARGSFGAFRRKLDEVQVEDKNLSGAERYVKLFYLAARGFCDENYNL